MNITTKKKAVQTIRYTDAKKKEVVDFVVNHNAANKSGGQSTAVNKFKISPITIASWLKAAGVSAPKVKAKVKTKAKKASKAKKVTQPTATPNVEAPPSIPVKTPEKAAVGIPAKAPSIPIAKAAPSKAKAGSRYTQQQKADVVAFVNSHNAANGRGGQSTAATKFNISPITVMAWLKTAGAPKASEAAMKNAKPITTAKAPVNLGGVNAKLSALLALSHQITKTETELAKLNAKFASIKASL